MNVKEFIAKILENTKSGKYKRKMTNGNTFHWSVMKDSRNFTFTLQRSNSYYIFTIQATNPSDVVIQLHGGIMKEINNALKQVFDEAGNSAINSAGEILEGIL